MTLKSPSSATTLFIDNNNINWVQEYVKILPKKTPFTCFVIEGDRVYVQMKSVDIKKFLKMVVCFVILFF